jgi:copper transport protein
LTDVTPQSTAGQVTVYETVTSDTSTAGGDPTRLDLDAGFFLGQEPYATGVAPIATRISHDEQPVRLALGTPPRRSTSCSPWIRPAGSAKKP